jgi:hypothetical protein
VVAPEHDRRLLLPRSAGDESGDSLACPLDLGEEPRPRVLLLCGLGDRGLDVAEVGAGVAELREAIVDAGIANGRGPHVDAPATCAEVERGTDDGELTVDHSGGRLFWNPQHGAAR